jgi:hypothetical protein
MQARVEDSLRLSTALAEIWQQPITGEQLQAEIDRQAANTRQPELLRELWAALGNDAYVIAETIARPALAERLARNAFERDSRFAGRSFDEWWQTSRSSFPAAIDEPRLRLHARLHRSRRTECRFLGADTGVAGRQHACDTIWTGAEMIVWGGGNTLQNKFASGARYNPATDTWRQVAGFDAPEARDQHTAVWTGTEMIVWGGCGLLDRHYCTINSGGRYNPTTGFLAADHRPERAGSTHGSHGRVDGQRDDHLGRVLDAQRRLRHRACRQQRWALQPADRYLDCNETDRAGRASQHTAIWSGSEMTSGVVRPTAA